jgi:peptide/nickel transport system substrate-binding protein
MIMTGRLDQRVRFGFALGLASFVALAVGACSPTQSTTNSGGGTPAATAAATTATTGEAASSSKVAADTFVEVTIGEPESLDPAWSYETTGSGIESNIYDTLVTFKRDKPNEFAPNLATAWKVSDDGKTYTFDMRKGVTFHEGGTLEPHDVAYSLQRAMLQDRSDGPMWLFLNPILGVTSIQSLVLDKAGIKVADGKDPPKLETVPADAKLAACKMVQDAVTADDAAGTVTIKLNQATPWFPQLLSQPWAGALDKEWMAKNGDWGGDCADWEKWHNPAAEKSLLFDKANGTGPYKLVSWKKGESISLDANDSYWRTEPAWDGGPTGAPKIKHVIMQKVPEWGTRFTKLQAGEADTVDVPRANIDQVDPFVKTEYDGIDENATAVPKNAAGILKLFKGYPTVSTNTALFSQKINDTGGNEFIGSGKLDGAGIPPDFFSDVHVRKAFNYCFDWTTFIHDALAGEGVQIRGPIIDGLQGFKADSPIYMLDLDKCKSEMAAAWGGKVAENGFKMTVAYNEGNQARQTAAEILAQNLATVNPKYKVDVIKLEWPTFLDNMRQKKLPLSFAGWLEDYHDASNWVGPFMQSDGAYSANQGFDAATQKQFDDLIKQGTTETDPAKRDAIYAQLQQMAYDKAIDIFLFQATGRTYMRDDVKGWYYNPLAPGHLYYPLSKAAAQPSS